MVQALNKRPAQTTTLLISVAELKAKYLHGVDLRDDNGNELPDSVIEGYIRSSQQAVEKELDILLEERVITNEARDFHSNDYYQYAWMRTNFRPLNQVDKVLAVWPVGSGSIEFNDEWIKADYVSGQINLVPTAGTISAFLVQQNAAFLPMLTGRDYVPSLFRIDYTAGFKSGEVPLDILEVIGMAASLGPFNIAGDLIAGAGIANKSISLDGLSQSIGTTSSATNAGYGARILQYEKQIKEKMTNLRAYWKGMPMVIG
jgi:hypothetical protein